LITKDDIFLLQSPFSGPNRVEPVLTMRHPLHPSLPPIDASHDRHCFSTQIPELGIFIIASPIGRVAIFAITKILVAEEEWKFGFELEYILPFEKDNEECVTGDKDAARRLVGVAASPVQGSEGLEGSGRDMKWRLMMYFTDHEVMSWEIGRKRGEDVGLGELVV
jgi:hypothetical protein